MMENSVRIQHSSGGLNILFDLFILMEEPSFKKQEQLKHETHHSEPAVPSKSENHGSSEIQLLWFRHSLTMVFKYEKQEFTSRFHSTRLNCVVSI